MNFLPNNFDNLIDDMPLDIRRKFNIFMHDRAPAHRTGNVVEFLNGQNFEWIGATGYGNNQRVKWPPRSPDLNPLDYFLWGYLKYVLHTHQINNIDELRANLNKIFRQIGPDMIASAVNDLTRRATLCLQQNGGHFEHL